DPAEGQHLDGRVGGGVEQAAGVGAEGGGGGPGGGGGLQGVGEAPVGGAGGRVGGAGEDPERQGGQQGRLLHGQEGGRQVAGQLGGPGRGLPGEQLDEVGPGGGGEHLGAGLLHGRLVDVLELVEVPAGVVDGDVGDVLVGGQR